MAALSWKILLKLMLIAFYRTTQNGTMFEAQGSLFIIDYYHSGESDIGLGQSYVLQYEAVPSPTPDVPSVLRSAAYNYSNHIIREPIRTLSSEDYTFQRNDFYTWLIRGPVYGNRLRCYIKYNVLRYLKLGTNCQSCLLTVTTLSADVRSFTGYGNIQS